MPPEENNAPDLRFNDDRPLILTDRNIAIPLWAVVSMIVVFTTATIYLVNTLNSLNTQIAGLKDQLSQQWTVSDAREFGFQLREKNREHGLEIPDTYEIHRKNRQ